MGGVKLTPWKKPFCQSVDGGTKKVKPTKAPKQHIWKRIKKTDGVARCSICNVTRYNVGNQVFFSKNSQLVNVHHQFC